jgi:pimeloyl-ACP methyl ester carboxylesterase
MHGYALNSLMWEFQVNDLSEHFTIIRVDLRGFGESSCGNQWGGTAIANDISGLIRHLNLTSLTIVGFSLSGGAAVRLALEMPDYISRAILVSSILPSRGRPKARKESERHRKELNILKHKGVKAWADAMGIRRGPMVDNIFKRNPSAQPVWDQIIERHNPDYLLCMMNSRHQTKSDVNWRARLKEIQQETLIIAGAQDTQFIDAGNYLKREIPHSKMEILSGAGHMLNLEKPKEFNRIIIDYLSG